MYSWTDGKKRGGGSFPRAKIETIPAMLPFVVRKRAARDRRGSRGEVYIDTREKKEGEYVYSDLPEGAAEPSSYLSRGNSMEIASPRSAKGVGKGKKEGDSGTKKAARYKRGRARSQISPVEGKHCIYAITSNGSKRRPRKLFCLPERRKNIGRACS